MRVGDEVDVIPLLRSTQGRSISQPTTRPVVRCGSVLAAVAQMDEEQKASGCGGAVCR